MNRLSTLLGTAAFAGGVLALSVAASAAPYCPAQESFFGTVQRVSGNILTVSTPSRHWATIRIDQNARVNTNGNSLRPGAYVGAYGCVTPNGVFHASEITLSANRAGYNETLTGIVEQVQSGRLLVRQNGHGYGSWYVPNSDDFHRGQTVTGVGMLGRTGAFYPQTVNGQSVSYDPDDSAAPAAGVSHTITLSGVVRRVSSGSLLVSENQGTTGTWIVQDAGRFRIGQHVVATGTEDRRGNFYPTQISVR